MKVLGAGLSKTGTTSLCRALAILGYRTIDWDTVRLTDIIDGRTSSPDFRRYDDVDAVTDLPGPLFFREFLSAYPDLGVVLTVRAEDAWWVSIKNFVESVVPRLQEMPETFEFASKVRALAYGSSVPIEYIYKKKFREHNQAVVDTVRPDRLLVMDITRGDGWESLCPFLGCAIPDVSFPRLNMASSRA